MSLIALGVEQEKTERAREEAEVAAILGIRGNRDNQGNDRNLGKFSPRTRVAKRERSRPPLAEGCNPAETLKAWKVLDVG
jgi:hypothetical protein